MLKVRCTCAYCEQTLLVSAWSFIPSGYPEDIYCPSCRGRNDTGLKSRGLAFAGGLAAVFLGIEITDRFAIDQPFMWVYLLLISLIGFVLGGMLSRRLVKHREPWYRRLGR